MATPAQDEFTALVSSNNCLSSHPEDSFDDTTTLAPSTISTTTDSSMKKPSLRGRNNNTSKYPYRDSDDEEEEEPLTPPKPSTYYLPKKYHRDAMTGPKGVIADAQAFEREKKGGRNSSYNRTKELALPRAQQNGGPQPRRKSGDENDRGSESEEVGDSDESDEVQSWKAKRRRELQAQGIGNGRGRLNRQYGTLEVVDGMRFLEAIERAGSGAVVVVFIYDDQSSPSYAFSSHLIVIAAQYNDIQFIALHCEDAEIDQAAVPAILAYRNGEKFADLMPLVDEVSFTNNVITNLEEALKRHGIL